MAYQDPFAGQYGGPAGQYGGGQTYAQPTYGQQQYGNQQQPQYGQYGDPAPEFNPYGSDHAHTYEPGAYDHFGAGGGYRDDPEPPQRQASHGYSDAPPAPPLKALDERSAFDAGEFTPGPRGPKTARNLRQYRMDFQGPLWTRGGRGSCIGRFFCCTFMILVFLVVTILLTLVLFLRPPSITFGDVAPMASAVQLTTDGININMGVNISFSIPIANNNTLVGGGNATNVVFGSTAETNFTFPFAINYQTSLDPKNLILVDLAEKCGILGSTKSDLKVHYKITVGVQILFVTVSPSISNDFTFACPLSANDLQGLLGSSGLIPSTSRREEEEEGGPDIPL
ncbi:hypothetical protein B0H14DRAFT_2660981 [Mycena olivaceomarginata]|nr:hypothetical protein B0H14DRAFT_2660981 [Mycena olivaceomarginata]